MTHLTLILESCLKRTNPFFRFLIVGALNTLVGLSTIFILMNAFQVNYWFSTFIGNGAGAMVSFFLNRTFTFNSGVSLKKGGLLFFTVIISCYFASYSLSEWISGRIYNCFPVTKHTLAVGLGTAIYTITNYLGQKFIVFTKK